MVGDFEQMSSFFNVMRFHKGIIVGLDQVMIARWWAAHCDRFMDNKLRECKEMFAIFCRICKKRNFLRWTS